MSSTKASFGSSVGLAIAAVYALTDQGFFSKVCWDETAARRVKLSEIRARLRAYSFLILQGFEAAHLEDLGLVDKYREVTLRFKDCISDHVEVFVVTLVATLVATPSEEGVTPWQIYDIILHESPFGKCIKLP